MHSADLKGAVMRREILAWLEAEKIAPSWFWSFSVAPTSKGTSKEQFYKYITEI